jgi:hypothetical protein
LSLFVRVGPLKPSWEGGNREKSPQNRVGGRFAYPAKLA